MADYDLAIIGGGINGTGIARDAAGRGLRVLLLEQNDLGSGTSSASTKLIHGGLRYLEHGALRLVREALTEREVLLRMAPHVIRPMRFVLPAVPGPRSPFMLRLGLFLYDWLGARKILPRARSVDLTHHVTGQPLLRKFRYGFEYSDCWADDSRLVALNALDAAERGAAIRTRTRVTRAEREDVWKLILNAQGRREAVTARVLVNAAGPWVGIVSETVLRIEGPPPVRLAKGSHIVVRKLFDHDRGYIFQNTDKRIVFALPFAEDFTLIGTTDQNFVGALDAVAPSGDEVIYLCRAVNEYLPRADRAGACGVGVRRRARALRHEQGQGQAGGRDARLSSRCSTRNSARRRCSRSMAARSPPIAGWRRTRSAGSRISSSCTGAGPRRRRCRAAIFSGTRSRRAWRRPCGPGRSSTEAEAWRLVRAYGTRVDRVMGDAKRREDIAPFFGPLSAAEVRYLMKHEWAQQPDDVLWRRSKLGLKLTAAEKEALAQFMAGGLADKAV